MKQIEVVFHHHSDRLAGTLAVPQGDGPHPAIIMLQGSGPSDRTNGNYFPPIRDYLVSQGFAVLCYDKPGTGYSTGDWQRQSFADRAHEALAAFDHISTYPMIDREKIGLWGHSQGGWIVFLAASLSEKIRFIVSNSGPGISLQEQDRYGLTHKNRALGVTEQEIEQALNLYTQVIEVVRSGEPYGAAEKLIDAERNQAWDNYFNYSAAGWAFMRRNAEYDPFPIMQKVGCPVLAIFGEADRLVPAQRSASLIKEALATGKNPNFTFHIFPAADHRIKVNQGASLAPGYLNAMGMWLVDRVKSKI